MRDISTTGVWTHTETMNAADSIALAQKLESLGYSTMWLPETAGKDPFALIGMLAAHTNEIRFATGIANIFHRHPRADKRAADPRAKPTGGAARRLGSGVRSVPAEDPPGPVGGGLAAAPQRPLQLG